MKIKTLLLSASILSTLNCFADDDYKFQFSIDTNKQTAFTGADLSLSAIEAYRALEDKASSQEDSDTFRIIMILPRLFVGTYASLLQHEVFGHGARVREIGNGWRVKSYQFSLDASGCTTFYKNRNSPPQHIVAVDIGGIQATEVLSNKIKDRIIDTESINSVYAASYITSSTDKMLYTFFTDYNDNDGNDIANYLKHMNGIYGDGYITRHKLERNSMLDLFDPFLYFSIYALTVKNGFEYPMIEFSDWKYLPALRGIYTPYGLETKLLNYFKTPESTIFQVNFSHGTNKCGTSWSTEFISDKLIEYGSIDFGLNTAIWRQPKIFYIDPTKAPNKYGGSFEINARFKLNESSSIFASTGYKTAGFRVGYPIKSSALIRVGLAFKF